MVQKRNWDEANGQNHADVVARPPTGTRTFTSGQGVKEGLASGSRQALVAFQSQIQTPYSRLPLAISHPTVVILQHYLDISPTCDEILDAWRNGDRGKNEKTVEAAVALLGHIISVLTPLPYFRTLLLGIVNKILAQNEPFRDSLNRLITSARRDDTHAALTLLSAIVQLDPPDVSGSVPGGSSGKIALKAWAVVVEGGSVRALGKAFAMRKRTRDGLIDYGTTDPLDRPDIRHLALKMALPLFSAAAFHQHSRSMMPLIYSNLSSDPPLTVLRVLTAIWTAVTSSISPAFARRSALALLNETSLEHLIELLPRKEIEHTSGRSVGDIVKGFLYGITTVPGQGVCFADEGWYKRQVIDKPEDEDEDAPSRRGGRNSDDREKRKLHNRILSNVIRKLGSKVVDDEAKVGEFVLKVLEACPELVDGYWAHSGLGLEPSLTIRWMATMAFVGRVISLPAPPLDKFRQAAPRDSDADSEEVMPFRAEPPPAATIIESVLPAPLNKAHLTRGLQHPDRLVQHMTATTLARGLQKLQVVQRLIASITEQVGTEPSGSGENPWAKLNRELEQEARRRVPDVMIVIRFAQMSAQIAPPESETPDEKSLEAKSSMLTETALRLFGLYYVALPSVVSEAKFDVGRLLVSSSSAKAEKKDRKEMRAANTSAEGDGSVADDTGSVASFGTAGTAGLGGGFGYSRGEVKGFEALSQVHVLSLLSQAREWAWTHKAAGSQYTYLYHILQLHLNTTLPLTRNLTTSLLSSLLLPTLLFDHDHSELAVWLDALPQLLDRDLSQSSATAQLSIKVQQIHLLSFLDDAFNRALARPYKYMEDLIKFAPDQFTWSNTHDMVSCVYMAILEQLEKKVQLGNMGLDAVEVVLAYLRRVILGLKGKLRDETVGDLTVQALERILGLAEAKGKDVGSLRQIVLAIKNENEVVFSATITSQENVNISETEGTLADEGRWESVSLEYSLLHSQWDQAAALVVNASAATAVRYGQFIIHLLARSHPSSLHELLSLLLKGFDQSRADTQELLRLKGIVFQAEPLRDLKLTTQGQEHRGSLNALAGTLDHTTSDDRDLADYFVRKGLDLLDKPKKHNMNETLIVLQPWARFLSPEQALSTLPILAKKAKKHPESWTPQSKQVASAIILAVTDVDAAFSYVSKFILVDIIAPFKTLVQRDEVVARSLDLGSKVIEQLFAAGSTKDKESHDAYDLIAALANSSPSTAERIRKALAETPTRLEDSRLLPTVVVLLDLPASSRLAANLEVVAKTAVSALFSTASSSDPVLGSARAVLLNIAKRDPAILQGALDGLSVAAYSLSYALLARELVRLNSADIRGAIEKLVNVGLELVVRSVTKVEDMNEADLMMMEALDIMISSLEELEIPVHLAEPVITSVIEYRMTVPEAIKFASLLCRKCTLKASFVRTHLQALLATPTLSTLSGPSSSAADRHPFITLYHALFKASTYVSCQPNLLEPLLPFYRGTLSLTDTLVLDMMQTFEAVRRISVISILRRWSSSGLPGSGRPLDALTSLETSKVAATCGAFPLRRQLFSALTPQAGGREGMYDPVFLLCLYAGVLAEEHGLSGLEWVEIMRTGTLGVVVCALSSRDGNMRDLASSLLAKTFSTISNASFLEKPLLQYTLRVIRHSLKAPETTMSKHTPRLPTLITLFLSHALRAQANPASFLFPLTTRFLLQRPVLDVGDVPMLYAMLYAHEDEWRKERSWMVRYLRDGTRSEADWRLLKRRHTWDLLATLYTSARDYAYRRLILQAMESFTAIPLAAQSLLRRQQIISWLTSQWAIVTYHPTKTSAEEKDIMLRILENVVISVVTAYQATLRDVEQEADLDEETRAIKEMREKEWVGDVYGLLRDAVKGADAARLETVSRIYLRTATVKVDTKTFLDLCDALESLFKAPSTPGLKMSVETLFRAGLHFTLDKYDIVSLGPARIQDTLAKLRDRAKMLDGEVGEWVRREMRWRVWEERRVE